MVLYNFCCCSLAAMCAVSVVRRTFTCQGSSIEIRIECDDVLQSTLSPLWFEIKRRERRRKKRNERKRDNELTPCANWIKCFLQFRCNSLISLHSDLPFLYRIWFSFHRCRHRVGARVWVCLWVSLLRVEYICVFDKMRTRTRICPFSIVSYSSVVQFCTRKLYCMSSTSERAIEQISCIVLSS